VYVAYFDDDKIVLLGSDDAGRTFRDSTVVSAMGENVALEGPSCVAFGADVVVAYGLGIGPIDTGSSAVLSRVVIARSHDAGRTVRERIHIDQEGATLLHPRLARVGTNEAALLAYAGDDLRVFRLDGSTANSRVVRRNVHTATRRSDPAWGGDYLGFAVEGTHGYAAFVDSAPISRIVFVPFSL
jgi:hypothetical protein